MNLKEAAIELRSMWQKPRPAHGPATHDYASFRGPGHDYTWTPQDGGRRGEAIGWGHGIRNGDFLLLRNTASGIAKNTKYRVLSVEYYLDPNDMWVAQLEWVPRWMCDQCNEVGDYDKRGRHNHQCKEKK